LLDWVRTLDLLSIPNDSEVLFVCEVASRGYNVSSLYLHESNLLRANSISEI
jgi:hypothetical protein